MLSSKTQLVLAVVVSLVLAQVASAAVYAPGHVWNRNADWTVRPPSDVGTTGGNPDDDSQGSLVWSYEYYANVPAGADLDTTDGIASWLAWPAGQLLTWDAAWWNQPGAWSYGDDISPVIKQDRMDHVYAGTNHVPVVRWTNPTGESIPVSITSGDQFIMDWRGGARFVDVDVMIALVDVSLNDAMVPLWSGTFSRPTDGIPLVLPQVALMNVNVGAGDQILISHRATGPILRGAWLTFFDDVSIERVPEPMTLSLLAIGGVVLLRRRRA